MNRLRLIRITGVSLILLVIFLNIPYIELIRSFEYDDILRQPVEDVLIKFHQGGSKLILTWFAFGLSALLFIPISILLHLIFNHPYLGIATVMGIMSGILQAIGLMRWVFVIPFLANLYVQSSNSTTQEVIKVVYQALHQYGGVVIGEFLGQILLIGWTIGIGIAMLRSHLVKAWLACFGLFTTPLLLLGQSELLTTVIPSMPIFETTPIGFMLWEVWILTVGIYLIRISKHRINL